ncbi:DNA segregation ATPase, FtsK/SpoIIIE family [Desulfosporosinus acidiphilus SJ4]|uniref:DNA segregation ATPase, FtsK/SpoIIIE family n=1 Tax=Desulfosporosinus acidiphilus (strain DSM 22704 / JCM 16185 / SJ4) TaxID=646529 RepID=I4D3V2_DESAJ|nr:DNA translocase FtsK [Desulfosporosinus acidiphilus]AFM40476.1 DNA segregation ATPase, FtsK/SpoIIIE family [Desulfosporosinus acidiphilus SJ4]
METYSLSQVVGLGLLVLVILDFIRTLARNGAIHIADFPVYLFVLLGRILDTMVALIFSLFSKNWGQLSSLKKSWTQTITVVPITRNISGRNEEKEWMAWARQKRPILIHTLERSGAHIFVERSKLPGQKSFPSSKDSANTPAPKVKTLDFQVFYSVEHQEVHFIPQYFYGVDPSLRSSLRQRIDDGTIAVAFGVASRIVSFVEREGQEAIVVRVGANTVPKSSLPPPIPKAGKGPTVQSLAPEEVDLSPISENLPPLTIFNQPKAKKQESRDTAEMVLQAFSRLNIGVDSSGTSKFRHVKTVIGPAITQVIFQSSGLKISSLTREGENIAAELGIQGSVRISAVPGMPGCFGVEVPNEQRGIVTLQEMVASPEFRKNKSTLPLCIGVTINGKPLIADLAKLPHLLVAGATNQGKSVGLNAMILSLVLRHLPDQLKLIMVDPKAVELTVYEDLPHLLAPIATEPKDAMQLLDKMVVEMERRYSLLRSKKARNIREYNDKVPQQGQLPYWVAIIDEYADLIMGAKSTGKDLETAIARLGQKARAAGLHLILATQRPTADIVTGLIKANMPGRLAYKVASTIDSQVILDRPGAESLTGMGDLLLLSPVDPEPIRAQGPLVTDEEIERLVEFWCNNCTRSFKKLNDKTYSPERFDKEPDDNLKAIDVVKQETNNILTFTNKLIDLSPDHHGLNRSPRAKVEELPNIPEVLIVVGSQGHMVNLGIPSKPKTLSIKNNAWAVLYGCSVRIVVKEQAPRREYLKSRLNIKTDVAQSIMQLMEIRKIISPYKGPNAPRQIYVSLEQVDKVFPENIFSMNKYTSST